ncbi:MAG TPA: glycoside hydrolase family 27 protein [Rhodanobacteraceae bacterium]
MNKYTRTLIVGLVGVSLAWGVGGMALAGTDGGQPGARPIMGWSSWSFLRKDPSAAKIEAQATAMRAAGLQEIGYDYINIDDFWYQCPDKRGPDVDAYGRWVTDASRFPPKGKVNGIKVVADYIHGLGMKFGIYVTPGISMQAVTKNTRIMGTPYTAKQIAEPSVSELNYNCEGMVGIDFTKPGAQAYVDSIADLYASWGVDFIKLDGVSNADVPDIRAWSRAIRQSGRTMLLDVTRGPLTTTIAPTLIRYADQWVIAPDVECYACEKSETGFPLTSWDGVKERFTLAALWEPYSSPEGGFNDFDSVEVGNGRDTGLTPAEQQTQLSLWAMGASPLILGIDLTHLNKLDLQYLQNTDVIAVDQDAIAAKRVVFDDDRQVFAKTESNGDVVIGLFNLASEPQSVSVTPTVAGLVPDQAGYGLKNLWTGESTTATNNIAAQVAPHGVVLYRVKRL